jgi:uncharacterized protein YlxW (UPF0749 family)
MSEVGAPRSSWRAIVPRALTVLVFAMAGLLFWISADTSHGKSLRSDSQLLKTSDLVREQGQRNGAYDRELARLREEVDQLTREQAVDPALQAQVDGLLKPSGLSPLTGPGVSVTLTDAPPDAVSKIPGVRAPTPDDLVVHQQDIQGVVNALWSAGATGIEIMDQRIIATSAVRCVGNTLILHGRVYSPPYKITAVGDQGALRKGLDTSEAISDYLQYVDAYGLGWKTEDDKRIDLPAYTGPLDLQYAKVS